MFEGAKKGKVDEKKINQKQTTHRWQFLFTLDRF